MSLLESLFNFFADLFGSIFSSSSPEYKKKQALRSIQSTLKAIDPPVWKQDGTLLAPLPMALYQIFQFIQPLRDTLLKTTASQDKRQTERYREYILELSMTEAQRETRKSFTLVERANALIAQPQGSDRAIEEQGREFSAFLRTLDSPQLKQASVLLQKIDALGDFCKFGFNVFLSWFDPAFKAYSDDSTTVEAPSFHCVEVTEMIPALLDLYYVMSRVDFSPALAEVCSILTASVANTPVSDEIRARNSRLFQAIHFIFQKKLGPPILLSILRVAKQDPEYLPQMPSEQVDYLGNYRNRLSETFHSDSRKLVKERQESEITKLISDTFGSVDLAYLDGYNEETNAIVQEFSTHALEWIMPLRIIKTFALNYFEPHFKQLLRSVIVEGFFNNRSLQSSFSSAYYACESISLKVVHFESLFGENQPNSLKILTGYITEMEKGMDFEKPLAKMVENINQQAKALVQKAATTYFEVFNFATIIIEDNKRSVPEYITNLRTITSSTKNRDSFNYLEKESRVYRNFLEIMKKYVIVGTLTSPTSFANQTEN